MIADLTKKYKDLVLETTRKQGEHLKVVGSLKAELGAAQHHL